jgi:hypothetical protein
VRRRFDDHGDRDSGTGSRAHHDHEQADDHDDRLDHDDDIDHEHHDVD